MDKTYLSQERFDELNQELVQLKSEGRVTVAERLKQAKEMGDLSENSEYQEAREEQGRLEKKIGELEEILRNSAIIKKIAGTEAVKIGTKIKVKKGNDIINFTIVWSNESNPAQGFISNESPIGKGLLGKKVGDVANIKTPKGETSYQILTID